jgi:hypothetical protein
VRPHLLGERRGGARLFLGEFRLREVALGLDWVVRMPVKCLRALERSLSWDLAGFLTSRTVGM